MSPDDLSVPRREQSLNQVPLEEVDLIVSRLAKMREMSATKRVALTTLTSLGQKTQDESIQPLIGTLGDPSLRKWKEREMAAWTLGRLALSAEEKDTAAVSLMDVLEGAGKEPIGRQLFRIAAHNGIVGFFALMFFSEMDPWRYWHIPFVPAYILTCVSIFPITATLSLLVQKHLNDHCRIAAAVALGNLAVPETVGALAGALRDRNRALRVAAAESLNQVLPNITENDFGRFGAQTITNLAQGLSYPDGRLVFKLLEALEKVGTGIAVPYVEKLYRSGRTVRVRDAADQVLKTLRDRQHRESQSDRLLRSATSPANPSEILLRPPVQANDADTLRLLRSSIEEMN